MSFFESPRFNEDVSFWAMGGSGHATWVVDNAGGFEQRNSLWSQPRCRFDVANAMRTFALRDQINALFRQCQGRLHGFRYKDWSDYTDSMANGSGVLDTGTGDGTPYYQLQKLYAQGQNLYRKISKPVSGTITVLRNAGAVTFGAAAGNCALDTTTGLVTFVADATSSASAITPGTTTQVTLAANLGLTAGKLLYLSGFNDVSPAAVNGIAHTINSITGTGPYVFTLATNTAGKTITLGSGLGSKFPQASDAMAWTGQFDVPVRFDTDLLQGGPDSSGALWIWNSIPLIELRL